MRGVAEASSHNSALFSITLHKSFARHAVFSIFLCEFSNAAAC